MALLYSAITSLDGFIADADGRFDWSAPDAEVHAHVNGVEASVGTHLLGRRMWDVLRFWDDPALLEDDEPAMREFAAQWRDSDKIVYSSSLTTLDVPRTTLARHFDPDAIRALVDTSDRDVSIGGAELAGHALRAGLVDEVMLYLNPVLVGGGTAALPADLRLELRLVDEQRFGNGVVFLRYRT